MTLFSSTQGFTTVLTFEFDKCGAQREHNQVKSNTSANNQATYFLRFISVSLLAYSLSAACPFPALYFGPLLLIPHILLWLSLSRILSSSFVFFSAKERRSRMPFLRQWSEVGHSRAQLSRKDMESWAKSLDALLESRGERLVVRF